MNKNVISWIAQIIVVVIIGQTLFFKFTDAPETVELFAKLGMGAFEYKLIGVLELIACILLLVRPLVAWGGVLGVGLMSGAIMAHVTKLGFSGDAGVLGVMAIIAWVLSAVVVLINRNQLPIIGKKD